MKATASKDKTERDRLCRILADLLPFAISRELIAHGSTPDRWHSAQFQITRQEAIEAARAILTP